MAKAPVLERAASRAEEGQFQEAVALFQQAIAQSSQPAGVHESLAQCLNEVGDYEGARNAASTATSLQPEVRKPAPGLHNCHAAWPGPSCAVLEGGRGKKAHVAVLQDHSSTTWATRLLCGELGIKHSWMPLLHALRSGCELDPHASRPSQRHLQSGSKTVCCKEMNVC